MWKTNSGTGANMNQLVDTALAATIVSASVTAIGWLASHWSQLRLETKRRIEKIVDVQTALLAEIDSNLARYAEIKLDADALGNEVLVADGLAPFVSRSVSDVVFGRIVSDIHILPTETIGDVIAYYKQEHKLRELVEDLRSEKYERLDQRKRNKIYGDYVWQIKLALVAGERAKAVLRSSLGLRNSPKAFTASDSESITQQ